ncbi:hypothetical protein FB45DRAFT_905704 [Roridomyces roridus]|uniref:Uncharacterized protein n=1 Tax=Roridomyces roridus TaxID=1738132 RepID=A0AAD7FV93_9AGAR|nr:hypothetical protein FB45DRAFT_905704 [Roridomyces roridus]
MPTERGVVAILFVVNAVGAIGGGASLAGLGANRSTHHGFPNQLRVPGVIDGQRGLPFGLLPFLLQKRLRGGGLGILHILGASRHLAVPAAGRVGCDGAWGERMERASSRRWA